MLYRCSQEWKQRLVGCFNGNHQERCIICTSKHFHQQQVGYIHHQASCFFKIIVSGVFKPFFFIFQSFVCQICFFEDALNCNNGVSSFIFLDVLSFYTVVQGKLLHCLLCFQVYRTSFFKLSVARIRHFFSKGCDQHGCRE